MKCFVTGATGHIGNVLVRELYENHHEVTSLVLPKDKYHMIEPYSNVVFGNILDCEFLERTIVDYDIVFHLAGIVEIGSGKKKKLMKVNVEGTKNIVDTCQKNHIKRMVYTSSVHAIPELPKGIRMTEIDHFDPKLVKGLYAKSKAMATNYVLSEDHGDLEVIIVHPAGVIGPYDYQMSNVSQLFVDFLLGRLTAYTRGGYNFVDVRDVARGIRLAGEKGKDKECYILSGHEVTVKELLDSIAVETGRKKIKTKLAFWFIFAMSYFAEIYYKFARQKPLFTHYSIVVLNSNYLFSNEKARQQLGYTTRAFQISIHDAVAFSLQNYVEKVGKRFKRRPEIN